MPTALSKSWETWRKIDTPENILEWIVNGVSAPFSNLPPPCHFENHKLTDTQKTFVAAEVKRLAGSGSISKVDSKPQCVVPIGCVPKKNKKHRLIVDLRYVNTYCESKTICTS